MGLLRAMALTMAAQTLVGRWLELTIAAQTLIGWWLVQPLTPFLSLERWMIDFQAVILGPRKLAQSALFHPSLKILA